MTTLDDITNLKDDMSQYRNDEISSYKVELVAIKVTLQNGQEAIDILKANVNEEMQT